VILTAEKHEVGWVSAVVAHVAERDTTEREARSSLLGTGTLVPVVAHIDEW
jgi:hypothetical protein